MMLRLFAIRTRAWMITVTLLIGVAAATAADSPAASDSRLDIMLERIRRDHAIPALAVGVVDAGEIRYLRTLGALQGARFRVSRDLLGSISRCAFRSFLHTWRSFKSAT